MIESLRSQLHAIRYDAFLRREKYLSSLTGDRYTLRVVAKSRALASRPAILLDEILVPLELDNTKRNRLSTGRRLQLRG